VLEGAGSLVVNNSFAQTGGSINLGGPVTVNQAAGNLVVGAITASSIDLTANAGTIGQNAALVTAGLLTAHSQSGVSLTNAGNQFSAFHGGATSAGNIDLVNTVALDLQDANVANGNITIVSNGGVSTSGLVAANGGTLSLTSNSPLTIGGSGVTANGNILLAATNLTSAGNMVLNGNVSSSTGAVTLNAAGTLTQNGAVNGPTGISATSGGATTFGPTATCIGHASDLRRSGHPGHAAVATCTARTGHAATAAGRAARASARPHASAGAHTGTCTNAQRPHRHPRLAPGSGPGSVTCASTRPCAGSRTGGGLHRGHPEQRHAQPGRVTRRDPGSDSTGGQHRDPVCGAAGQGRGQARGQG
jgi:hypothetical protein